jgi:extradiol dioxygenase family protein
VRESRDCFHLAIPSHDLDEAKRFYVEGLGCHLARRYDDRITIDFFGDQLVCHLSDQIFRNPELYPRHFGITFRERDDFDAVHALVQTRGLDVFRACDTRFHGAVEEHLTFVLRDPSDNLIEFKWYRDHRMMY